MTLLDPAELIAFSRTFRFAGGRIRRMRMMDVKGDDPTLELILSIRSAPKSLGESPARVRLHLHCEGVEEFRFQKRPGTVAGKMTDCQFGSFQGLVFINFDAWGLMPGDAPKVHDFRASDAYLACRRVRWERIEPSR